MTRQKEKVDFDAIWDRAKHGGLSEEDIAVCMRALQDARDEDLHLPLLVIGVARTPTDSLVRLVARYLMEGRIAEERSSALRVLCRYWNLWSEYLPVLLSKLDPKAWNREYRVAREAVGLIGEYLFEFNVRSVWRQLLVAYEVALQQDDISFINSTREALILGLRGPKGALEVMLSHSGLTDEEILNEARRRANMLS